METPANKCPTCGLGRNPAHTLCPKCNKTEFLAAVKNGMDPFANMKAGRVAWIALIAFGMAMLLPSIAIVVATFVLLANGTITMDITTPEAFEAIIYQEFPYIQIASSLAAHLLAIIIILIVVRKYLGVILASFKRPKAILMPLAIMLGVFILSTIWSNLSENIFEIPTNSNQEMVIAELMRYPVMSFITTAFTAPLLEEITFRCGIFGLLKRKSVVLAMIVSTLLFAAIHLDFSGANLTSELIALPAYLMLGLSLGFIYHKYGFVGSLVAHVFNNTTAAIMVFTVL